jgi:hypothetical protein
MLFIGVLVLVDARCYTSSMYVRRIKIQQAILVSVFFYALDCVHVFDVDVFQSFMDFWQSVDCSPVRDRCHYTATLRWC